MGSDKKTRRHLKVLSSDLGPAWHTPASSRRRESTGTPDRPQNQVPNDQLQLSEPEPTSSGADTPLSTFKPKTNSGTPTDQSEMSSRGNQRRGANRNSENSEHGEEFQLWKDLKDKFPGVAEAFNQSSSNVIDIRDQDKRAAEKRDKGGSMLEELATLDASLRNGVKANENAALLIQEALEKAKLLRAVQKAKEDQPEPNTSREANSSRAAAQRAKETAAAAAAASLYDFDGSGESPVPSPSTAVPHRMGGGSKGDRDSLPPSRNRSTPAAKAGSVEPQAGAAANAIRSKQTFAKDDEVAFKPKPVSNEQTDWILGIVQDVRGDGKSRRYRVLDADVDENGHQKDFRTSASSMILIPKDGTILPPLETGKIVLALYPNTTTFYKAEVMGMDGDGKVNLKFEGEESSNTMQAVTRRHVVEYRG
ncbi:SGF29 tudor-like domain-containing protein [Hypoxylon cercidicola]|nr:SGF29 tudor-like domain-containing protein [Hypoxylon cercidicola]